MAKVSLNELFDMEVLQQIQDAFSEYTGLAAIMTDSDGVPVTSGSGFTDICTNLTRCSRKGLARCMECDKNGTLETLKRGKPYVYKCHAGLCDFAAPIMLEDTVIGGFIGGQAAYEEIDDEKFRKTAVELGIDPDRYVEAAHKVKMMNTEDIEEAAQFLFKIAKAISMMAYKNYGMLKQSHQLERDAQIRASYLLENVTSGIKSGLDYWLSSTADILGNSEEMDKDDLARMLMEKSGELYSTVSDTVDYLKETEQSADYEERTYDISEFFDNIKDKFEQICYDKKIDFNVSMDIAIDRTMFGNERSIGYIVEKLCSNAVRYMDGGYLNIHVSSEKTNYSDILVIKVSNTGVGMDENGLSDIRSNLANENTDIIGNSEAAKMGFAVIGMLVRKMSGTISVDSEIGGITTFVLRIPQLAVKGGKI